MYYMYYLSEQFHFFFMKIVQDVEGPLGIILGMMQLVVNLGMMKLA